MRQITGCLILTVGRGPYFVCRATQISFMQFILRLNSEVGRIGTLLFVFLIEARAQANDYFFATDEAYFHVQV